MELLWLSEGGGIGLDGGSVGFVGYVSVVGGCCVFLRNTRSVGVVDWFGFTGFDQLLEGVVKHRSVVGGCCEMLGSKNLGFMYLEL